MQTQMLFMPQKYAKTR